MKRTLKWSIAQKIELKWWERYLKNKDTGEYLKWKMAYWQGLINRISDTCSVHGGMRVLDAGCGPAGIFMALGNCVVDAVDPLLEEYEKNLAHFIKLKYPHVTFYTTPLEKFTPGERYDIIFCMNAINHVSDIQACYSSLSSVVKQGGKLVVSIDAHNHNLWKWLFRFIPGDMMHPHQFSLTEYARFLTTRGFRLLQTDKIKRGFFFSHYIQVAEKI